MSSDRFVTVTLLPSPPRQEIQDTKRAPVARALVSDPRKGETSPRKAKHESCPIPADIPGNMRAASHHARRDVAAYEWKARAPGTTTLTEARYVTVTHLTDATRYPIGLSPNVFRDTRWIIFIIHEKYRALHQDESPLHRPLVHWQMLCGAESCCAYRGYVDFVRNLSEPQSN
jgi:hypothetical protein